MNRFKTTLVSALLSCSMVMNSGTIVNAEVSEEPVVNEVLQNENVDSQASGNGTANGSASASKSTENVESGNDAENSSSSQNASGENKAENSSEGNADSGNSSGGENTSGNSSEGNAGSEGSGETSASENSSDSSEGSENENRDNTANESSSEGDDSSDGSKGKEEASESSSEGETSDNEGKNENASDSASTGDTSDTASTGETTDESTGETSDGSSGENAGDSVENPAADKTKEEGVEKEPLNSSAFFSEADVDGYHFEISAAANIIPEGATVEITKLKDEEEYRIESDIQKESEKTIYDVTAFDIVLKDSQGEEIQPAKDEVHIVINLSQEAAYEQEELLGYSSLEVYHIHEGEGETLKTDEEHEDSDIRISDGETSEEVYVDDSKIDPETNELKEDLQPEVLMAPREEAEYLQNITVSCDTGSFSTFAVVTKSDYTFNKSISGNTTTIDLTGTANLSVNFMNVVNAALTEAYNTTKSDLSKYYKIIVPAGTYRLDRKTISDDEKVQLRMYSNTTLEMNGVTLINTEDHNILTTKTKSESTRKGQYDDYQNISIIGGTLDCAGTTTVPVRFAHMTGFTMQNVTIQNSGASHMLELGACKDVKVTGCTFKDISNSGMELEAFQIDAMRDGSMTYERDPVYDDYPCDNVEVTGCTFSNLNRGFGSHTAIVGEFYYTGVRVQGCNFNNIKNAAIMCTLWKDSSISGNTMSNVGKGVDITTYTWYTFYPEKKKDRKPEAFSYNANITITGNNIAVGGADRTSSAFSGVILSGYNAPYGGESYPQGTYKPYGFTVMNNTIQGYTDWGSYSDENIYADIYGLYATGITASSNQLYSGKYGVLVQSGGEASDVSNNGFAGETGASIAVKMGGTISSMNGNMLTKDCAYGLYVDDESTCNGTCLAPKYVLGVGETLNTRSKKFSLFTNDLSNRATGSYGSNKKSIVKTTSAGKIKGKKRGTTSIIAEWVRGGGTVTVSADVQVKKAPTKIKHVRNTYNLKKGATHQLKPEVNSVCSTYKFSSSNKKVAKVTSSGLIQARKKGTATITITTYNGVKKKVTVKVK